MFLLSIFSIVHPYLLEYYNINKKKQRKGFEKKINKIPKQKRKERDSNPRYEKLVQRISNPTLSSTQPSLPIEKG